MKMIADSKWQCKMMASNSLIGIVKDTGLVFYCLPEPELSGQFLHEIK